MCKAIYGNSLELIKNIPNNSFNLIFLDPPYGEVVNEDWDTINPITTSPLFITELQRVLKPTGSIYICCGLGRNSQSLIDIYPLFDKLFYFQDIITWVKSRGNGMRKGWLYTREELLWFSKDKSEYIWNAEYQYNIGETRLRDKNRLTLGNDGKPRKSEYKRITNVWTDIPDQTPDITGKNKIHKTPKPEKLLERIILLHTKPNDVIFDPFAGTSTTGFVANKLGREYYLIEKEQKYCGFSKEYYRINYDTCT